MNKWAPIALSNGDASFGADQHAANVIPDSVSRNRVGVAVKPAARDGGEIESTGAKGSKLSRWKWACRPARDTDNCVTEIGAGCRSDGHPIEGCSPASHRFESLTVRQIEHERDQRTLVVDDAQTGAVVRDAARGIGGTVHGIDDDDLGRVAARQPRLLAEYPNARIFEDLQRPGVGDEIESVLVGSLATFVPAIEPVERVLHLGCGAGQENLPVRCVHCSNHSGEVAALVHRRMPDPSLLDVAEFCSGSEL